MPAETQPDAPASAAFAANHSETRTIERIASSVSTGACVWIVLVTVTTLIGWWLHSTWLVRFPTPQAPGTLMVSTSVALLLSAGSLWLLRNERQAIGVRRQIARALAAGIAVIGILSLVQYVLHIDAGIDWVLFRAGAPDLAMKFPGRPATATSVALLASGLALLWLDAKTPRLRHLAEALALSVTFIGMERFISFLFGETGAYAPTWQVFGQPVLQPMSPKTATCFIALSVGILYARPQRGLVGLFLERGPGGLMARWLLSAAVVLPIVFGGLGLLSIRAGLRGSYPLSLVVTTMIVLLILVVSLNARTIARLDKARNRALARAEERERLLSAVFDNAGAGLALVNVEGRPVATNRAMQQMLHYTEEELAGLSFQQFSHPDDAVIDQQHFNELLAGERDSYRIEKRYLRKDGGMFWGQLNVSVARDEQARPVFIVRMIEDISERKEAEEAQRRLTEILEATPDFVGIANAQGRALYVNRAGREITGANAEDISGLTIPDFHPVGAAEIVLKQGLPAATKEGLWQGETALLSKDGDHIPVSQVLLAHRGPDGGVAYYSTIMRDITDRKRLEETQQFLLEASQAISGSLEIDTVLRSITELSVPGRADYCAINLVAQDGTLEHVAVSDVHPADQQRAGQQRLFDGQPNPLIEQVVRTGAPVLVPLVTEEWLKRNFGPGRDLDLMRRLAPRSLIVVPLRGVERVLGAICFCSTSSARRYDAHDLALAQQIAARAALALENARLLQQSREATRLRDEVLRVVAHDLRNPLNTISLSAGLLDEQMSAQERNAYGEKLEVIIRSVERADRLIQDLLDVARMQAGRLSVETEPLNARALVEEVVELHQPLAAERDITLRADLPQELANVPADRHRLQQVLANLIGNALKFTGAGGHVTVRIEPVEGALTFSVQDDGRGIAQADMQHLFDPFWQARKGAGGAGLGLPICRGIVEAHGGRIWAESELGQGSTFIFTLPLDQSRAAGRSMAAD